MGQGKDFGFWLKFFVFSLFVLTPIVAIKEIILLSGSDIFTSLTYCGDIALSIFMGISIIKIKPYAIQLSKVFLFTGLIGVIISLIMGEFSEIKFLMNKSSWNATWCVVILIN